MKLNSVIKTDFHADIFYVILKKEITKSVLIS